MDIRNVNSLMIAGKAVKTLMLDGRLVWAKSEPPASSAYIETDGRSYMDLGFTPTEDTTYEISAMYISGTATGTTVLRNCVYGANGRTSTLSAHSLYYNAGYSGFRFVKPTTNDFTELSPGDRLHISYNGSGISVNGRTVPIASRYSSAVTMKFGTGYAEGGSDYYSVSRFYSAKFWESGVLIRDLVPYSGTRGVGLLDRVHDVLYTNAGGGSLTYGEDVREAYVQTKGLSDSFWYVMPADIGLVSGSGITSVSHFAISVDMEILNELGANAGYGFMQTALLDSPFMNCTEGRGNPYVTPIGVLPNPTYSRNLEVVDASRKTYEVGFDPDLYQQHGGMNYASDGTTITYGTNSSAKLPQNVPLYFGGYMRASATSSVSRPCTIRVFGIKVWQFHNLVADLSPYMDGDVVGMVDAVSGRKFPGSNLEYGEE